MEPIEEKILKKEISHIFESGANEIRIFEMVKMFVERRWGERYSDVVGRGEIVCPNCGCNKYTTDASDPNKCINCGELFRA